MRRVIRKRVRHSSEGIDLALDLNADIVVNVERSSDTQAADPEHDAERSASTEQPDEGEER